jgi:hypothetical protein
MISAALEAVQHWTSSQVHDTVAAIARQPEFAGSARQSLIGRFFRFVMARLREVLERYEGSTSARYVVIAALALVILVVLARAITSRDLDAGVRRRREARQRTSVREDLWMAARRAAAAGDHVGACHLLYAAVLERLANLNGLTLHPSKTSGDYWRELRRRGSPGTEDFRVFARRFERAVYGSSAPGSDDVDELLALADRLLAARRAA